MSFSGKHKTVVGGRDGLEIVGKLLSHSEVKKVIFGRIGTKPRTGHGLRFKITRVDERGNLRAILSYGSSSQEIYVITTASSKEEGERIAKELIEILEL
ncbi:MAG: DUF2103 domain-containing protein [Archaeoglobaceae archaeon]